MKDLQKLADSLNEAYTQQDAGEIAAKLGFTKKLGKEIFRKKRERQNKPRKEESIRFFGLSGMYIKNADLGYSGRYDSNVSYNVIRSENKNEILAIVNLCGWCQYSSSYGTYIDRSALVGKEDEQWFSTRIPSSITDIEEAKEWLKPAEVKKAETEGREVIRQGDIYFVQMKRKATSDQSFGDHVVTQEEGVTKVRHPQHGSLVLEGENWKSVRRKNMGANGRGD